jgi:Sec-independent protein translocase protein TatA
MSFSDTIFLFFLALILFGPKKLPEMARQAGKLLAELRRASNEFKSQIETEITRLEVQKTLPPNPPPAGTIASFGVNPAASVPARHDSLETLVPPTIADAPLDANSPSANATESNSTAASSIGSSSIGSSSTGSSNPKPSLDPVIEPSVPAAQEPHV